MKKIVFCLLTAVFFSVPVRADEKIEKLLQNDQEILRKLEEIQAELQVVKVRATQNG